MNLFQEAHMGMPRTGKFYDNIGEEPPRTHRGYRSPNVTVARIDPTATVRHAPTPAEILFLDLDDDPPTTEPNGSKGE